MFYIRTVKFTNIDNCPTFNFNMCLIPKFVKIEFDNKHGMTYVITDRSGLNHTYVSKYFHKSGLSSEFSEWINNRIVLP